MLDQVILEQFLKIQVRVFIRKRSPGTSMEVAKLADDYDGYLQARREDQASKDAGSEGGDRFGRRCYRCGKVGHLVKDCQVKQQITTL